MLILFFGTIVCTCGFRRRVAALSQLEEERTQAQADQVEVSRVARYGPLGPSCVCVCLCASRGRQLGTDDQDDALRYRAEVLGGTVARPRCLVSSVQVAAAHLRRCVDGRKSRGRRGTSMVSFKARY